MNSNSTSNIYESARAYTLQIYMYACMYEQFSFNKNVNHVRGFRNTRAYRIFCFYTLDRRNVVNNMIDITAVLDEETYFFFFSITN
jgi:hypothetical protein